MGHSELPGTLRDGGRLLRPRHGGLQQNTGPANLDSEFADYGAVQEDEAAARPRHCRCQAADVLLLLLLMLPLLLLLIHPLVLLLVVVIPPSSSNLEVAAFTFQGRGAAPQNAWPRFLLATTGCNFPEGGQGGG